MFHRLNPKNNRDVIFFLSYCPFIALSLLCTTFYYRYIMGPFLTVAQIVLTAVLVLHEIYNHRTYGQNWKGLAVLGFLCVIAWIRGFSPQQHFVTMMFLYAYSARNISFEKIIRATLYISIGVVVVAVLSGYIGLIDNVVIAKGDRVREYMGFRYALFLPGILLNMTALWVYLRRKSVPIDEAILWAVVNWIVYVKTDSRISFALAELLIVAAIAMRFLPKIVEKVQPLWAVMTSSFVLFGGGSIFLTCIYNSDIPWMRKLNSMLETRLSLGKSSLERDGFALFGQHIDWVGNGLNAFGNTTVGSYTYVDCLYIRVLQKYGLVFLLLLTVLLTWGMIRLWKKKQYHILLILASVAAHCVLDDLSISLHYNTFWIALAVILMNPKILDDQPKPAPQPVPEEPAVPEEIETVIVEE